MDCTMAKYCWDQAKVLTSVKVPRLHPLTWAHELVDPGFCSGKDAAVYFMWYVDIVDGEEQAAAW